MNVLHLNASPGTRRESGAHNLAAAPTASLHHQDGSTGAARVGEGFVCLTTLSHCYVARFKPSGELLPLYSVPQPGGGAHVPAAAWLPHGRRPGGADTVSHGSVVVPVAVLALAWGPRLVLFNVPLVGDHLNAGDVGARGLARFGAGALCGGVLWGGPLQL
jgi:hypothetical protein